ncbi:DUF4129 domain-containing protein [Deinococcus aquaedulcis]|uniref:DUF4129 domain-containing protein n=1 Tax=Deinococcus aquaedulcis TaxID=2840455 RepID=UPI001C82D44A|nr:DUF4129 domain-containing protein [Deinococcus aquaedulcis]
MVSAAAASAPGLRLSPYGVALLPLCLAGALPWWVVAALVALLALGVRWPVWSQGRVLLTQLVLGVWLLTAVPGAQGQPGAMIALGAQYLLLSLLGFALIWGVNTLEDGQRRGLLAPLLTGLIFPQPLVLVALAGGALARPGRHTASAPLPERRAWWGLLGGGLLGVTLLAALLPPTPPLWTAIRLPTETPGPRAADQVQPTFREQAQPPAGAGGSTVTEAPTVMMDLGELGLPGELTLLGGLLCLVAAWRVLQGRAQRRGPPHPAEVAMVLGLVVLALAWWVAGGLLFLGSGGGGGPPGSQGQEALEGLGRGVSEDAQATMRLVAIPALMKVLVWLTALLFLGVGLWLLRLKLRPGPALPADPNEAEVGVAGISPAAPLHRVRRAYREASAALAAAGLGRAPAETPASYAARLGAAHPALAAPLHTLTAAYEPVRYGGHLTDDDASAAEAAARTIQILAPTLPPPEDTP